MKNFKRYALKQTLVSTSGPFDIVIADYKLPKINGLQVAREILAVCPRQRVILASAHFEDEVIDVYTSRKNSRVTLRKPFTKEVLIETIEEYKEIYDELEKFGMDVIAFKGAELRYDQLVYILEVLRQVKKKAANEGKIKWTD